MLSGHYTSPGRNMASTLQAVGTRLVILLLVLLQLHGIVCARSLTSTAATNSITALAEVLAKVEGSKAALQQYINNSSLVSGSLVGKNMTQINDSKRIASIVNLVGADVAYILWAALSISANSFSLLTFTATTAADGEVNIDIPWVTQFAALVAGVQAEVADLMSSIEGLVADAKGGASVVLGMKTAG